MQNWGSVKLDLNEKLLGKENTNGTAANGVSAKNTVDNVLNGTNVTRKEMLREAVHQAADLKQFKTSRDRMLESRIPTRLCVIRSRPLDRSGPSLLVL